MGGLSKTKQIARGIKFAGKCEKLKWKISESGVSLSEEAANRMLKYLEDSEDLKGWASVS